MMQSSNIVILYISLALLVRLWPSPSVVYGRSKGSVLSERGARSLGGDGVAVASDGPNQPKKK